MLQAERKEVLKSVQKGEPFATGYQLLYRGVLKPLRFGRYQWKLSSIINTMDVLVVL